MILDVIREVVSWLEDPLSGVNALLPAVPRAGGEPAPPAVRVFDEIRHPWVARGVVDPAALVAGPILVVHWAGELLAELLPERQAAGPEVDVAIRYATRRTDTAAAARDAHQTHRAVMRVIAAKYPDGDQGDLPTRNGVTLYPPSPLRYLPLAAPTESTDVLGAVVPTFPAHDPWVLALT